MARPVIDLALLFERRLVDQCCPRCGLYEAAGSYCTRCRQRTSLPDYRAARPLRLAQRLIEKGAPLAA